MRKIYSLWKKTFIGAAFISYLSIAIAQDAENVKETEASATNASHGFVRLWNFANNKENVAVFLAEPGKKALPAASRIWLARGSTSGEVRSYSPVAPGKYEIFVINDGSTAGNMKPVKDEFDGARDSLLVSRIGITVTKGSYQTVQLKTNDKGRFEAATLNDGSVEKGTLRIFNFTEGYSPSVTLVSDQGEKPLTNVLYAKPETAKIHNSIKRAIIRVNYTDPEKKRSRSQTVECDFSEFRSCSVAITHDRYGRFSVINIPDAPINAPTDDSATP